MTIMTVFNEIATPASGYATVNGLTMYYEIEGTGDPLVYIPPSFAHVGMKSFPALAQDHSVIMMDLQGHGRTADIPERPLSIERYAEDVVGLLRHLGVGRADFLGESYGGNAAVMIAVRHPELVGRVAACGATFGPPEIAHNPEMLRFDAPPTPHSRDLEFQRESYKTVAPNPEYWQRIWEKMGSVAWNGFSRAELASIEAPVLIVVGDRDFVRVEHALESSKLIPNAELAVIPDAGHFVLFSEPERVIPVVKHFLEKPQHRLPVATAAMGYHPGETR
jgi:pimeloyl-ACP methyl ester carboxylesterase